MKTKSTFSVFAALLVGVLSCQGQVTAVDDTGATDEDTLLTFVDPGAEPSLLANDMSDDPVMVLSADSASASGAAVSVATDGTFTYNPTGAPTLQALEEGASVVDTFTYTITEDLGAANGRFIQVQNNGTETRRMDIGEIEVFAPGVTPAVDNAGDDQPLNPTIDLATTANGASVHSKGATSGFSQPHGTDDDLRLIDGLETDGGGTWSSNGVENFVIIDLGASMDVETVRVHQRNGCCQDRLSNFTVSLLADNAGAPGAVVTSAVYPDQPPGFGEVALLLVGTTDTATVSVTVGGLNDAPIANSATFVVQEGDPAITEPMTGSDVDTGDTVTFTATSSPAKGVFSDNGNGTFTFDPNGEFESLSEGGAEVVSFDFEAEDTLGLTSTATITIVVRGENDAPVAMADGPNATYTTDEDTPLNISAAGVLGNDTDTDGDALGLLSIDTTGTTGIVTADLTSRVLPGGLSGTFYDLNGPNPDYPHGNNNTGNQEALLMPLRIPGLFVLQRLDLAPSATVITPRVDFGTGTDVTQGDGLTLDRGGYSSGDVPPWQGLFNDVGETADMDGDQLAAIWTGKISITSAGDYTFTTRSDDGTVLFINGTQVVDNNLFQGMTNRFGTIALDAGLHDIVVGGYEGTGGAGMQASYEGPDTVATRVIIPPEVLYNDVVTPGTFVSGGLRGDYYDTNNAGTNGLTFAFNPDEFHFFPTTPDMDVAIQALYADPSVTGILSPRIDFGNDTTQAPGDGSNPERGGFAGNIYGGIGVTLDGDQVGGVWNGSLLVPEDAEYQFWQRIDDGGVVMIDVDGNGSVHDAGDFYIGQGNADGTVILTAGLHKIVVASREGGGAHRMVVSWAQLDGANPFGREVIPPDNLVQLGAPEVGDGSFTFDPNGQFEALNDGESAEDTFTYTATDPFGGTSTGTVTIRINGVTDTGSPYDLWAAANNLTGGDALATADPDSDGLVNLLEFGFGTDPDDEDNAELLADGTRNGTPTIQIIGGGDVTLNALFIRRDDFGTSGSLDYTVQFSADLITFHDSTVEPTIVVDSSDDAAYHVARVPYPGLIDGKKQRFYRVKVEIVP